VAVADANHSPRRAGLGSRTGRGPPYLAGPAWYDFACAEAVAGKTDAAIDYLQKTQNLSPQSAFNLANDEHLESLHKDPRFIALIAKAKQIDALPQPSK
jgi:hypothetical protein